MSEFSLVDAADWFADYLSSGRARSEQNSDVNAGAPRRKSVGNPLKTPVTTGDSRCIRYERDSP